MPQPPDSQDELFPWNRVYLLVIAYNVLLIVALYVFSAAFDLTSP